MGEPERADPSKVMQAIKQGFARRVLGQQRAGDDRRQNELWSRAFDHGHVWQARFYDFVVFTGRKRVEKVLYMHHSPVKRELVDSPEQWRWSRYRTMPWGIGESCW